MAYYPTPADANIVETWTRAGIGKERIANRIGITVNVLEKHYQFELGYTEDTAVAIVADVAYQMATSGKFPTMTKWWLEVRAGWVTGIDAIGSQNASPLQIMLDSSEVIDGEYDNVEESNVLELSPS